MPFTYITMREGTSIEHRESVSQSTNRAMVDVLGITEDDRFHVINNQGTGDLLQEPTYAGVGRGAGTVMVHIYFTQRTPEMKQRLFETIVANLGLGPGVRKEDIYISVVEPAPENWWIFGGEVDPETGFDVRMADAAKRARNDR